MTDKVKINLYIDKDTWENLKSVLKEKGYPRGVPSWLAQNAFEHTILQLKHIGESTQLDLFFNRKL